jgi:hypothetical protein
MIFFKIMGYLLLFLGIKKQNYIITLKKLK